MNATAYIENMCPPLYLTKNTKTKFDVFGKQMDILESDLDDMTKEYTLSKATDYGLERWGHNLKRARKTDETTEQYREALQILVGRILSPPTHEKIAQLYKTLTGNFQTLIPLWMRTTILSWHAYYLSVDMNETTVSDNSLQEALEYFPAGVKIEYHHTVRLQTEEQKLAAAVYDYARIKI